MKSAKALAPHQAKFQLAEFAQVLGIGEMEAKDYLKEHFHLTGALSFRELEGIEWVEFNVKELSYALPLSPQEWGKLNQLFQLQQFKDEDLEKIKTRLADGGRTQMMMNFISQIEAWDKERDGEMAQHLKTSIEAKNFLRLIHQSDKIFEVIGLSLLHVEGVLSLIAEELSEHCLMVIPVHEIRTVEPFMDDDLKQQSSRLELEDFVKAMRLMSEKETRLILKIYDPSSINLFPEYHFLGKPCMITNPEGDLIWAAYVEPCQDLYEWIITLGDSVEILDPQRFKEDYYQYCLEKYKRTA